ncbi:MAG: hypothetical protein IKA36_02880 [Clostridia bacterium]|nr:hypothetical protein [Clostridia bacterium]
MATRKTASKTSSKVKLDINLNEKQIKKSSKKAKKQLKKISFKTILITLLILVLGTAAGYFALQPMMKNDCFIINGKDEITLTIGESYKDEGAKIIAFGKDISTDAKVKTNMEVDEQGNYTSKVEGTYYMEYTVDHFKYGSIFKIKKVRLITFVEPSEEDEKISANEGGNV